MIHLTIRRDIINSIYPIKDFTKLEAYIDLLIYIDEEKEIKIYALAKRWGWSRTKTKAFIDYVKEEGTLKVNKKDSEKNSKKDIAKDSKKNIMKCDEMNTYIDCKDSEKNSKKDTTKDSKINIDLSSINEILGM